MCPTTTPGGDPVGEVSDSASLLLGRDSLFWLLFFPFHFPKNRLKGMHASAKYCSRTTLSKEFQAKTKIRRLGSCCCQMHLPSLHWHQYRQNPSGQPTVPGRCCWNCWMSKGSLDTSTFCICLATFTAMPIWAMLLSISLMKPLNCMWGWCEAWSHFMVEKIRRKPYDYEKAFLVFICLHYLLP